MRQKTIQILSICLFVGLVLLGGFSLIAYLGVPVHGAVLMNDLAQQQIDGACEKANLLCRGLVGLFPFLIYTISRLSPFLWYAVLCGLFYGIFVLWQSFVNGEPRLKFRFRPVYFVLLFIGCLWLLFTTLTYSVSDGMPVRQIVEPTAQTYANTSDATLKALHDNFDALKKDGCLTLLGQTQEGIDVYEMSEGCMQKSFVSRVLSQVLVSLFFLFELLVLGRFLLQLISLRSRNLFEETVLSLGAGACGWIVLLWCLAVAGIFSAPYGWAFVFLVPILFFRQTWYWIRKFFSAFDVDVSWHSLSIVLGWLIVSYLAINFLTVVRPFPIGWDDLGSYLNRPKLLVSYGHFIFSMSPFEWEYLTSVGFLLFGYASTFGATASMMINWTAGLLALLSVWLFARTFLGKGRGMIAALLYYSLPLVGHFSFADMKIDNAVFFAGALGMFCVFTALFSEDRQQPAHWQEVGSSLLTRFWHICRSVDWAWFALGGVFTGFAFGMKPTAVMVLFALIVVLLGTIHWTALLAGLFLGIHFLLTLGPASIGSIAHRLGIPDSAIIESIPVLFLIAAVLLLVVALVIRRKAVIPPLVAVGIFGVSFALTLVPWILHNNILAGNIIPQLQFSAPNTIAPKINYNVRVAADSETRILPADLAIDPKNAACIGTGSAEELDRYWGFTTGIMHYLTLPWRTVMNIDSAGYYVTTIPALLLFPLLLLLPFFWTKRGRWLRWLFLSTTFILLQWMFVANGIPWYGIGVFLGLVCGLEAFVAFAPDSLNVIAIWALIIPSLLIAFANRTWQFEQQRNLLEYPMGKVTAEALRLRTIPYYDEIAQIVLDRNATLPDRPYLYRVGTFISYFIPKNLELIGMTDHQLDAFHCLNQEKNPELTLKRLKALGINSIIFDTNTATIERDPAGSLHKKVQEFLDFLNTPSLHLQVVVNDPSQGVSFILLP
jgi:hypothetical protein